MEATVCCVHGCDNQCTSFFHCIQIKLQRSDNDFVLSVRNRTTPGMVITNNVIPLSTKGGMGHGMGLKNVVAILQKYHAEYILSSKDGWFQFTALAYL